MPISEMKRRNESEGCCRLNRQLAWSGHDGLFECEVALSEGNFSQSHKGASRRRAQRRAVSGLGVAFGVALQFSRRGALLLIAPVQAWCFWLPWFCACFFAVSACTILQAHCTS